MKKLLRVLIIVLFILPLVYLPMLSVAGTWRFPALLPNGWTLSHWIDIQRGGTGWLAAARTSLVLALSVGLTSTTAGFLTAQHLSWHPKRQWWIRLSYFPYAFSPVVYAFCLKFFFNVTGLSGTLAGVWLAQFILTFPFAILLFFNHFDHYLKAMEQLSFTMGASSAVTFLRVLAPASKTVLLICFFQIFLISWFEYGLTSVIGLGQVRTLTISVYQYISESNIYVAALASCLLCLPPVLLLWFNQRFVFAANRLKSAG